jgi:lipid-binding SYLF domain-containing protein
MVKKILALACVVGTALPALAATDMSTLDKRLDAARATIEAIEAVPDKAIPTYVTSQATCVGVIPGLIKGAFIFGGEYGQGVVTCRTGHGWSGPVFIKMTGGSFGFQIGGSGTDLVLVAVNQKGFQDLLETAQAATNWKLQSELLTWSRSKGLFAGIDLNGVAVFENKDDTAAFYGAPHSFESILKGHVLPPAASKPFLHSVAHYFRSSVDAQ